MKKILLALILPMSLMIQGCDDRDVALGAGLIAGVIIGSHHDHAPRCHGGYRTSCSSYRDRWGNRVRECREIYNSCARHYSAEGQQEVSYDVEAAVSPETATVATKYQIGFDGADKIVGALGQAQQGDLAAVEALGLTKQDLQSLSRGRNISKVSMEKLSLSLNLDLPSTKSMIRQINTEVRSSKARQ